ncbi:hypothetical protein [Floricoccus penangensis]|uniref:hypothetical protein n=1 Tax=Floricoccus penangensis TaxID=1859475 RepID=UPI002040B9C0|nr:hypothetical protein [Floricoccus penangensis]URZ88251.1 hypothetical protein KIW23_04245 [Floricoccus penangensis]
MKNGTKEITLVAILAAIIAISGSFKFPGIIPGTEFQLSAPIAVAICATFGFKRYITAGIMASLVNLALGTHTIFNVIVAMVFRLVAGGMIGILGSSLLVVSLAGPIGTVCARVVLSYITSTPIKVLVVAALPGMLYTLLSSYLLFRIVENITLKTPYKDFIVSNNRLKKTAIKTSAS